MYSRTLATLIVASFATAACVSNEPKSDPAPAPVAAVQEAPPVASKPECPPEPTDKKKTSKTKTKSSKKADTAEFDCEPAKSKNTASNAKGAEPPPAPAKEASKPSEPGKPRMVKSRDGSFDGEIYGNIPANSKWAKLQIGMHQSEVERILGVTSNIRGYVTGKAFIPFYFGNDSHRYEAVYAGQGSVAYTGGGFGGGQGVLMMINYDSKIQ